MNRIQKRHDLRVHDSHSIAGSEAEVYHPVLISRAVRGWHELVKLWLWPDAAPEGLCGCVGLKYRKNGFHPRLRHEEHLWLRCAFDGEKRDDPSGRCPSDPPDIDGMAWRGAYGVDVLLSTKALGGSHSATMVLGASSGFWLRRPRDGQLIVTFVARSVVAGPCIDRGHVFSGLATADVVWGSSDELPTPAAQ